MRKEESELGLIQDLYISSLPLHVSLLPYLELCLRSLLGKAANLHAFLQELQIPCRDTKFSVSSSQIRDSFEWRTTSLSAILSRNLFRIDMWRMLIDVARFNHFALDLLRSGQITKRQRSRRRKNSKQLQNHEQSQQSIGAYLANEGYSNSFRDHYIIPLISVLWNVNNAKDALELPIVLLLRFMADCDLLRSSLFWSKWMCLTGGINEFEAAIANIAPAGRIHCNTTINSIKNSDSPGWLAVQGDEGHIEYFNHVIIATSAYDALNLISAGATDVEVRALDGFKTARTVAILHSDTTVSSKFILSQLMLGLGICGNQPFSLKKTLFSIY